MDKIIELQKKILTDSEARKELCDDPKGFFEREGIELPEGVELPDSFSHEDVENQVGDMEERLSKRGLSFGSWGRSMTPSSLIDPRMIRGMPDRFSKSIGGSGESARELAGEGKNATAAGVVALVVVAWTAVGL